MKQEMLINVSQPEECRIAIVEDGLLEELYIERASADNYVGNIYKGRIVNLEPSIQAAFVDFGVGRNGFLHISDVEPQYFRQGGFDPGESMSYGRMADIDVGDDEPAMAEAAEGGPHEDGRAHDRRRSAAPRPARHHARAQPAQGPGVHRPHRRPGPHKKGALPRPRVPAAALESHRSPPPQERRPRRNLRRKRHDHPHDPR